MIKMNYSFFKKLDNAEYDDCAQKLLTISLNLADDISNEMFASSLADLKNKYLTFRDVYKQMQKDWEVDVLTETIKIQNSYLSTIRTMLRAQTYLPANHPNHDKAVKLLKWFSEFKLNLREAYGKVTAKARNIYEEFTKDVDTLVALGIKEYVDKAMLQTNEVDRLLISRITTESSKILGQVKAARTDFDLALKNYYGVINSMQVLDPSDKLTELCLKCKEIETRAKIYYITNYNKDEEPVEPLPSEPSEVPEDVTPSPEE